MHLGRSQIPTAIPQPNHPNSQILTAIPQPNHPSSHIPTAIDPESSSTNTKSEEHVNPDEAENHVHPAETNENGDLDDVELVEDEEYILNRKSRNKKKRFARWVKHHFMWVLYTTMIIQVMMNLVILIAIPGVLRNESLYMEMDRTLTNRAALTQCIPMLAPSFMTPLILCEWCYVRNRYRLTEGDLLGVVGLLLLLLCGVGIDTVRLIEAHTHLSQHRVYDGKKNARFDRYCRDTYDSISTDEDYVVLLPKHIFVQQHKCCGRISGETIFLHPRNETVIFNGTFRCCKSGSACGQCNYPTATYTICLTRFFDDMSVVYSAIYPLLILFAVASGSHTIAFIYYNSVAVSSL